MKIGKIVDSKIQISNIYTLFPNTSFPDSGPPDSFIQENELYKVEEIPQYDEQTQKVVVLSEPIIKNNLVYTFRIEEKTEIEKNNDLWVNLRLSRDVLLRQSDKFVFADMWEKYTEEQKNSWRQYRQMLRDLPQNTDITKNVIWPTWPIRTDSTTTSL